MILLLKNQIIKAAVYTKMFIHLIFQNEITNKLLSFHTLNMCNNAPSNQVNSPLLDILKMCVNVFLI